MGWLHPEDTDKLGPPKAWLVCAGLREHFAEQRKQAQEARAEMHAILKAGGSGKRAGGHPSDKFPCEGPPICQSLPGRGKPPPAS